MLSSTVFGMNEAKEIIRLFSKYKNYLIVSRLELFDTFHSVVAITSVKLTMF
jgi:hypothetical protein